MKKCFYLLLTIIITSFISFSVKAEETKCTYSNKNKIRKEASNVKATYDIKKNEDGTYYFNFYIYNVNENIYVSITNNVTNETYDVFYGETDHGTYSFIDNDLVTIKKYTMAIKGMGYGCTGELRKINITKPRYNDISELRICQMEEVDDTLFCEPWVTKYFTNTREEIIDKINRQIEQRRKMVTTKCVTCEEYDKVQKDLKRKNQIRKALIIGSIIGIIVDLGVIYYLVMSLKRNEI